MNFNISWKGTVNHESFLTEKSCTGNERIEQGLKCRCMGISDVRNENLISNFTNNSNKLPTSRAVLSKISQECLHRNRISTDVIVDICASKKSYEANFLMDDRIKGYIHDIAVDPYGALFFCNLQVYFLIIFSLSYFFWKPPNIVNPF